MPKTINQRMTVKLEGDFVVFLIGMRINKFWKIHKWLPVARAMPRMLKELRSKDSNETGFLGGEFSRLVRAVAERLILRAPAGTPPVISRCQFDGVGAFLRADRFGHGMLLRSGYVSVGLATRTRPSSSNDLGEAYSSAVQKVRRSS